MFCDDDDNDDEIMLQMPCSHVFVQMSNKSK